MDSWTSGYVAELSYTHGFYRELTPHCLTFSALVNQRQTAGGREPQAVCELGCGQGFSTNLLAAANPSVQFYATDFNPAQIAGAQQLARKASIANVRFFDDSFAQFEARDDLPQFDMISLHGIYTWIAKEHRDTIVRFIDKRLKPGGLVYISYNCLPGWSGAAPLRQLMRMAGAMTPGSMVQKIEAGWALVDRMKAAGARYFPTAPGLETRIDRLKSQPKNYIAHEFMNADWTLFYHSDVAEELSNARLNYMGSAHLLDHVDEVNLTADQQKILRDTADPVMRETLRDYMINQQFRRDVFARGAVPLKAGELRDVWLDSRFALSTPRAEVSLRVRGGLGEVGFPESTYAPILDAFSRPVEGGHSGAMSLRQLLLENPKLVDLGWGRLQQAITVLVGANYLQPCPADAEGEAGRRESTSRFNQAVLEKARYGSELQFLASPVTGGGVAVEWFHQLFLLAHTLKENDPCAFVWRIFSDQGQRIAKGGKALQTAEENLAELKVRYEIFEKRLGSLRSLGIA